MEAKYQKLNMSNTSENNKYSVSSNITYSKSMQTPIQFARKNEQRGFL
jgi:hypothetical protein